MTAPACDRAVAPAAEIAVPRTSPYITAAAPAAGRRLSAPGALLLGSAIILAGVTVDRLSSGRPSLGLNIAFVLACAAMALAVRVHRVAAAVVAAPLLFASGVLALSQLSGEARGLRQLGLDVATHLALSAPILFGGTALTVVIALTRFIAHVFHRKR